MQKLKLIPEPIEQIGKLLKRSAWTSVIESLILILLGIFLITNPNASITIITSIAGSFFVIKGLYQIINYFISKGYNNFFNNNLLWGVISVLIGATLFLAGDKIVDIFRIVLGIWVIYSSLVHINTAIKLSVAGIKNWFLSLIFALIMLTIGGFLVFNSGSAIIFAGWLLVFSGISGIISDIFFLINIESVEKSLSSKN